MRRFIPVVVVVLAAGAIAAPVAWAGSPHFVSNTVGFLAEDLGDDDRYILLSDAQKVFLISPRRYGKSSLIRQALGASLPPR